LSSLILVLVHFDTLVQLYFIYSFLNSVEIVYVNRHIQLTCSTAPPDKLPSPFGAHVSLNRNSLSL